MYNIIAKNQRNITTRLSFENYSLNTYETSYTSHRRLEDTLNKIQINPYSNYDVTAKKK